MENLDIISAEQFAEAQAAKINSNFTKLKNAVDNIPQGGGESGGSTPSLINLWQNRPVMRYGDATRTLKVLVLGNSYTNCSTFAIPTIIANAGITSGWSLNNQAATGAGLTDYVLHDAYPPSNNTSTIEGWWNRIVGNSGSTLAGNYDIVVLNQASPIQTDWDYFVPEVGYIIDAIRHFCTNKEVKIAFHMSWNRYHAGYSNTSWIHPEWYQAIVENTQRLVSLYGVDIVIPCGTAIENVQASGGNVGYDSFYSHLVNGLGEYAAAAAWYESIIRPFFNSTDLEDSSMLPSSGSSFSWTGYGNETMTLSRSEALLAAKCAKAAVENLWDTSTIE